MEPKYKENKGHFSTAKHFATDSLSAVNQMKSADEFISHVHSMNGMTCMGGNGVNPYIQQELASDKKNKK